MIFPLYLYTAKWISCKSDRGWPILLYSLASNLAQAREKPQSCWVLSLTITPHFAVQRDVNKKPCLPIGPNLMPRSRNEMGRLCVCIALSALSLCFLVQYYDSFILWKRTYNTIWLINHPIGSANKMIRRSNTICDLYWIVFKLIAKKEYDKFYTLVKECFKNKSCRFWQQSVGYD